VPTILLYPPDNLPPVKVDWPVVPRVGESVGVPGPIDAGASWRYFTVDRVSYAPVFETHHGAGGMWCTPTNGLLVELFLAAKGS
jgi:hypothetical protein